MECLICHNNFNHLSRQPRAVPCCGISLCDACCIESDSRNELKCPNCRKIVGKRFQDLTRNISLKRSIPDWNYTECKDHSSKINEMICKDCRAELCVRCINNHKSHDVESTQSFYEDFETKIKNYKEWIPIAKFHWESFQNLKTHMNSIKDSINKNFDKLIAKLEKYREKALDNVNEKYKSIETQTSISTIGDDGIAKMTEILQECQVFLNDDIKNQDITTLMQLSNINYLEQLKNWSLKFDAKKFSEDLGKIQLRFVTNLKTPFSLVDLNNVTKDTNPYAMETKESYFEVKEEADVKLEEGSIYIFDREVNRKILEDVIKEKLKPKKKKDKGLATSLEDAIYQFHDSIDYNFEINSLVEKINAKEITINSLWAYYLEITKDKTQENPIGISLGWDKV